MDNIMNILSPFLTANFAVFVTIQMLNVIISTVKSVLTINGSKFTAAVVNSVSYTFANIVTKLLKTMNAGYLMKQQHINTVK